MQPTPRAGPRQKSSTRVLYFLLSGGHTRGWLTWGVWVVGKEGSRGDREGAGRAFPMQSQAHRDSPTAQRSAKRSSPSSAWIRSFRLFLVAALFNTALNKGWEGAA